MGRVPSESNQKRRMKLAFVLLLLASAANHSAADSQFVQPIWTGGKPGRIGPDSDGPTIFERFGQPIWTGGKPGRIGPDSDGPMIFERFGQPIWTGGKPGRIGP